MKNRIEKYELSMRMLKLLISFTFAILLITIGCFVAFAKDTPEVDKTCGPKSLKILCDIIGVQTQLEELYRLTRLDESGTTMRDLADAACALGLNAVGMKLSLREVANLNKPVIAWVQKNHFVVIERIIGNDVRIIDPNHGVSLMLRTDFSKIWKGHVLVVSPKKVIVGDQPQVHFEELVHNFGTAPQQKIVAHQFGFKNVGKASLVISEVRSSCICTATLLSKKELFPGEAGVIEIKFNTELRRGPRTESVQVLSNDPYKPVVYLTLTGIIAGTLVVVPNYIYFGDVSSKESLIRKLEIFDPVPGKLKVKKVKTASPYLTAKILSKESKEKTRVLVTLHPGMPLGPIEERVIISTSDAKNPQLEVLVKGNIQGYLQIFPKRFFFGFVEKGQTAVREITLTNTGSNELSILNLETTSPLIATEAVTVEKGKKYLLKAIYTANADSGSTFRGTIKIHTNDVQQPLIEVPLYAAVR